MGRPHTWRHRLALWSAGLWWWRLSKRTVGFVDWLLGRNRFQDLSANNGCIGGWELVRFVEDWDSRGRLAVKNGDCHGFGDADKALGGAYEMAATGREIPGNEFQFSQLNWVLGHAAALGATGWRNDDFVKWFDGGRHFVFQSTTTARSVRTRLLG